MRTLLGCVLLAACGASDTAEPVAAPAQVFRDQAVPISSAALFDVDRFAGDWVKVARYPVLSEAGCALIAVSYLVIDGGGLSIRDDCRSADGDTLATDRAQATIAGPGQLRVLSENGESDLWVLWVDEAYRTAVLGAPDGRSGWILNRSATIPTDRLIAAKVVLDFNGYDLTRLRETTR